MKTLVVFYSRTGNTRKIGKEIAGKLNADLEEIIDLKNRKGIFRWFIAGKDGMKKNLTKIKYSKNPGNYDLIVIGTPIWVSMAPAIRAYLIENKNKIKKIAFFITSGSGKTNKTFEDTKLLSKRPIAVFSVRDKETQKAGYMNKLNEFCRELK